MSRSTTSSKEPSQAGEDRSFGHAKARGPRAEEILDVACELIAESGFDGVGMRAIAEAAGMQGASLYNHFRSKEEMLYEICLRVSKHYNDTRIPLMRKSGSFVERLEELVRSHIVVTWTDRFYVLVLRRDSRRLSTRRAAEIDGYRREYQRQFHRFLVAGVKSGEFRCADPKLASIALLSMLNDVFAWFKEGGKLSVEQMAERQVALVKEFLGVRPMRRGTK